MGWDVSAFEWKRNDCDHISYIERRGRESHLSSAFGKKECNDSSQGMFLLALHPQNCVNKVDNTLWRTTTMHLGIRSKWKKNLQIIVITHHCTFFPVQIRKTNEVPKLFWWDFTVAKFADQINALLALPKNCAQWSHYCHVSIWAIG